MPTIRPTRTEDLDRVVALEAAADTVEWLCETGRAWHERALADRDQEHLVVEYDGAVIGFGVLAGLRTCDGVIELRRMAVDPAHRGSGTGRALLRAAIGRALDRHGAHRVWLDVKVHNERARLLYESEGFVPTETQAGAVAEPDGTTSDLLVMVRQPSS
jgi:ribosomal protein S18 acetylase RimI-like enzyme